MAHPVDQPFDHPFRVGGWELYLTFHSYGQMVLYPWGYDRWV